MQGTACYLDVVQLDLLKARLNAALSAEAEAQRRCQAIQRELDRAHDELHNGRQQENNPDWRASEIERLDEEVWDHAVLAVRQSPPRVQISWVVHIPW